MVNKLKQKLILIFSCSTSMILLAVIVVLFFSNYHERLYRLKADYNRNIINLFEELKDTENISANWIARMETDTKILILIDDNGTDLKLLNTRKTRVEKIELKQELKEQAKQDGFDCENPVFHSDTYKSDIYQLHKNENTYYYATLMTTPITDGYRTIYLIMEVNKSYGIDSGFIFRFGSIAILGILLLFLFSSIFINLVLRPLERNQQKQRDFIASVSHEIKSPLTVITTGISNLKTELYKISGTDTIIKQCQSFLPVIENECVRTSKLINDMLLLATTDSHNWHLNIVDIDMETLLIELYDFYSIYEGSLHRYFNFDLCTDSLHHVSGDKDRINQIITILIDNAYQYTSAHKGITLKAYNTPHHVHIEVIDYGVGIEDSKKELVFDRFYQIDLSRSNKLNFGLGLSIAKELVDLHHGKIYVKDTPMGGATFCITLPRKSPQKDNVN